MQDRPKNEAASSTGRQRMGKLFRVLVLGGAVLAVAAGAGLKGATGTADDPPKDGGTPGW